MNSAGIELKEKDYSDYVQSISNVSVGCIGEARRGPLVPTLVTSQEELISIFGEPIEGKYGLYGAYLALTNVKQLYYMRIVGSGTKALAGQVGVDKISYATIDGTTKYNGYKIVQTKNEDNTIKVEITKSDDSIVETFDNLSLDEGESNLVEVINSQSAIVRATENESGDLESKTLVLAGGTDGASVATAGSPESEYYLRSKYPDSDING